MRTDLLALFLGIMLGNPTTRKAILQAGDKASDIIAKRLKEFNDSLVKEKEDDTQVL